MSELIDNRAWRVRTLKHTLRSLLAHPHETAPTASRAGRPSEAALSAAADGGSSSVGGASLLGELLPACDASEIVQAEQELIEEGFDATTIRGLLDPKGDLAERVLVQRPVPSLPAGHPVQTFRKENAAIADHLRRLREAAGALDAGAGTALERCQALVEGLLQIERHFRRKEALLFPVLESQQGAGALCRLMRSRDDAAFTALGRAAGQLAKPDAAMSGPGPERQRLMEAIETAAVAIDGVLADEMNLLLPMALQTVTEVAWGEIWRASGGIGWCLVEPDEGYEPPTRVAPASAPEAAATEQSNGAPGRATAIGESGDAAEPAGSPSSGATAARAEAEPKVDLGSRATGPGAASGCPAGAGAGGRATDGMAKGSRNGNGTGAAGGSGGAPARPLSLGMMPAPQAGERPPSGAIALPSGWLTLKQLVAIFATMPVDLTFVDADDRVRFFSEGPDRVFMRPRAVLGRRVQDCHPVGSIDIVERIIEDFRTGRQDVAEFWIQMRSHAERVAEPVMPGAGGYAASPEDGGSEGEGPGAGPDGMEEEAKSGSADTPGRRFIHIRYFALRDAGGTYLGTLEVTQDLTRERHLRGERRLLQYR